VKTAASLKRAATANDATSSTDQNVASDAVADEDAGTDTDSTEVYIGLRSPKRQKTLSPPSDDAATISDKGDPNETEMEDNVTTPPPPQTLPRKARSIATKDPRFDPAKAKIPTLKLKNPSPSPPASSPSASDNNIAPPAPQVARPTVGGKSVLHIKSNPNVVSGKNLPRSSDEAVDSAYTRYQLHLTKHQSGARPARYPDFPPEFFDKANFTKKEKEAIAEGGEGAPVRCVCGAKTDDGTQGTQWIGCSTADCGVWQHVNCMGEAVPAESVRETKDYYCQQCAPFAHRRLIQRLRKAQAL
jgi:hypothetical protein